MVTADKSKSVNNSKGTLNVTLPVWTGVEAELGSGTREVVRGVGNAAGVDGEGAFTGRRRPRYAGWAEVVEGVGRGRATSRYSGHSPALTKLFWLAGRTKTVSSSSPERNRRLSSDSAATSIFPRADRLNSHNGSAGAKAARPLARNTAID